jgi:ketosteroid isomerase-like protein
MKTPTVRSPAIIAAALVMATVTWVSEGEAQASATDTQEVVAVIDAFHSALSAGDSATALAQLAEDIVILESGGVEDKTSYRSGHLRGDMRFAQAVPRQRGDIEVKIRGDAAWAYSTSLTEGQMGERTINSRGAELVVLVREAGSWKIEAIHWSSRSRQ